MLLAAGPSERFGGGRPKQLVPFLGRPLVRHAARQALDSGLAELIAVVGWRAGEVSAALAGLELRIVDSPDFRRGQSASVRAGLAAVDPRAPAAIFLPADQPFLTAAVLDRLLDAYRATGGPIVVPTHRGRRGAPVLFDRALFAELATITGDAGGRQLLPRHTGEIVEVELDNPLPLHDVDDEASYRRLLAAAARASP